MKNFYQGGDVLCPLPTETGLSYKPPRAKVFFRTLLLVFCTCLLLFGLPEARAQGIEGEIKPLQVGDTIPEELWNMPLQVVNHPEGKDTITLNDYRDKKLIILDFWATWCTPCIKNFPKIKELQEVFNKEIKILAVTHENKNVIDRFFQLSSGKKYQEIHTVVEDSVLKKNFPHQNIPHVVWLTSEGTVNGITDAKEMTRENIHNIIRNQNPNMVTKTNLNREKPLFLSDYYGSNTELKTYSILVKGQQTGLPSQSFYRIKDDSVEGRCNVNMSLLSMYQFIAVHLFSQKGYRFDVNETIILDVEEPEKLDFKLYEKAMEKTGESANKAIWEKDNLYSYDIILSLENSGVLYTAILDLLNSATDYNAQIEPRQVGGEETMVFVIRDDLLRKNKN